MAVRNVKLLLAGDTIRSDVTSDTREASERWAVTTDTTDSKIVAVTAAGVPRKGWPYSKDPFMTCVSVNGDRAPDCNDLWFVDVGYFAQGSEFGSRPEPMLEPVSEQWAFASVTEPIDRDIHGKPITNSSKEPYDTPLQAEFYDQIMTIQRNYPVPYRSDYWGTYIGRLNDSEFRGWPRSTARMISAMADYRGVDTDFPYLRMSIQIAFRSRIMIGADGQQEELGWIDARLDQGYRTRTETPLWDPAHLGMVLAQYTPILDGAGDPISKPVLLDGNGQQLPGGGTPVYRKIEKYHYADLNALGI